MPVRIYDISKKLGLDNKQVLAKAKALNLTAARVASSSLDKITAEYLEIEILKDPELAARHPAPPVPSAPPVAPAPEAPPVGLPTAVDQVVTSPAPPEPAEVETTPQLEVTASTAPVPATEGVPPVLEAPAPVVAPTPPPSVAPAVVQLPPEPVPEPTPEPPPPPPPPPPGPKVGDKVGFIQLRPKPGARTGDKSLGAKLPPRPVEPKRTEFTRRGDIRSIRGPAAAPLGPAMPGARFPAQQKGAAVPKGTEPPAVGSRSCSHPTPR